MTNYIGLDAHSKTCTAVVMGANGKLISSTRFPTSERNLRDFLKSIKIPRLLALFGWPLRPTIGMAPFRLNPTLS